MCSLGDKGRALFALAHDDYDASLTPRNDARTSASGVILWRKDKLVLDGGVKWMTCIWRFEGNALVLVPHDGSGAPGRVFVTRETQFTAPKRKRYPVQFGAELFRGAWCSLSRQSPRWSASSPSRARRSAPP